MYHRGDNSTDGVEKDRKACIMSRRSKSRVRTIEHGPQVVNKLQVYEAPAFSGILRSVPASRVRKDGCKRHQECVGLQQSPPDTAGRLVQRKPPPWLHHSAESFRWEAAKARPRLEGFLANQRSTCRLR